MGHLFEETCISIVYFSL